MGKKYDITNCSPSKHVIQLGLRHIHPNQTAYSVDEKEITSGVMKLVNSKDLRMVDSIGKKAALKKANMDRPILVSPPRRTNDKPTVPVMTPRGITAADLEKFPWLSPIAKPGAKPQEVNSGIKVAAKGNGTVEISAAYVKMNPMADKLAKAKKASDEKIKAEADAKALLPSVDLSETKPKRRRRKKNIDDA